MQDISGMINVVFHSFWSLISEGNIQDVFGVRTHALSMWWCWWQNWFVKKWDACNLSANQKWELMIFTAHLILLTISATIFSSSPQLRSAHLEHGLKRQYGRSSTKECVYIPNQWFVCQSVANCTISILGGFPVRGRRKTMNTYIKCLIGCFSLRKTKWKLVHFPYHSNVFCPFHFPRAIQSLDCCFIRSRASLDPH